MKMELIPSNFDPERSRALLGVRLLEERSNRAGARIASAARRSTFAPRHNNKEEQES
jgi:hypothetical protein